MHPRLLVLIALLGGCGAAPVPAPLDARAASGAGEDEGGTELSEIATLEARLAEAEAENAALRAALSSAHRSAREACAPYEAGLGAEPPEDDALGMTTSAPEEGDDDGSRPVLRLYGPPVVERPALAAEGVTALAGPAAPAIVAAPPPGTLGRLVVTDDAVPAIPASPVVVAPRSTDAASAGAADPAVRDYQDALRRVAERDLDGALRAFASFLAAHPSHAYADNALYWRAEVFYARHEWSLAVTELESLLGRFPSGSKVPDALLRLGMCWERLGDSARARVYFDRLVREHPESTAAHMAGREDT